MSEVANRRELLAAVRVLTTSARPTAADIVAVFNSLSEVLTDLSGQRVIAHFDVMGPDHKVARVDKLYESEKQ